MPPEWPVSLQQLLDESYTETEVPRFIKSEPELGPQKARTVYTKKRRRANCAILCNKTEYTTLVNFVNITLGGAVLPFNFKHPLTQENITWTFEGPPTFSMEGPIYMRATMQWIES